MSILYLDTLINIVYAGLILRARRTYREKANSMSFMDEIRRGHRQTIADQTVEHQRLVEISRCIIRDDIGINYRNRLHALLKDRAKKLYASRGMIDVFRLEHTVMLNDSISECDIETVRQYLESEWRIAFDAFDRDIGGTNRHKVCHSAPRGGYYPALVISVTSHDYVPPDNEYQQPYHFRLSVTASYCPPIK